jgi:hypothetical protein
MTSRTTGERIAIMSSGGSPRNEGSLETKEYRFDRRIKLVRRTDVEKLAALMQRLKNGVAPR